MTNIYGSNGTLIPDTDEILDEMFSTAYRMSHCFDCGTGIQWNQEYEDLNIELQGLKDDGEDERFYHRSQIGQCEDCQYADSLAFEEYRRTKYDGIIPIEWIIGQWKVPYAIEPWRGK